MIGVTKFRIRNLKQKHGAHVDEKYLWDSLRPIIPYPTGRFFRGTLSQALRAGLRSVLSLRDALADISPQHLAKAYCEMSRRDGAIVAWHEVPGTARPKRAVP